MMKSELVFIPFAAAGHLSSAIQFAKLLVSRDKQLSIRILIFKDSTANSCIQSVLHLETTKAIQFIELPLPKPEANLSGLPESHFFSLSALIDSQKSQVKELVAQFKETGSSKLVGFVVDMFTTEMIDVANEFEVPSYIFYTSGAATIGLRLHLQSLRDDSNLDITEYKDSDTEFSISTYINPVPAKLFPATVFDKFASSAILKFNTRLLESKGVILNTFSDMESYALRALTINKKMPPVYTIGPLLNFDGTDTNHQESEDIMRWLDDQPTSSVVFLCFGSLGSFDSDQVKEIAHAIEHSGCRFLWSLRRVPSKDALEYPSEYENHEDVLPEGFLQRTSGVGKIIGWAPQVQILSHPALGGFVTHCGWNSVLESVWFGVPMAVWPLYAEQQVNAFLIMKDLGLAAEIKMDYSIGYMSNKQVIVKADEIENGIRQLMQPDSEMKKKVKEMMKKARSALVEGGSSTISLASLIEAIHGFH